jgi:uroporphyrinogen-III synthase
MPKVWLTRTRPAADESAVIWRVAGFEPVIDPLLKIEPVAHDPLPKEAVIIFTSKNGVDNAIGGGQRAICVGDATAQKAREAGYRDVISVNGTSVEVKTWLRENLPKTQDICHASGWHAYGSITENLKRWGFKARRVKTYRSVPYPIWPEDAFSGVVFYSPLAAQVFAGMCEKKDVSSITAVCISKNTAKELTGLELKSICIANRPREDELIMAAKLG